MEEAPVMTPEEARLERIRAQGRARYKRWYESHKAEKAAQVKAYKQKKAKEKIDTPTPPTE